MRIDFYQLGRDPVEGVVPLLAGKARETGVRVLVISADASQRAVLADALWAREGAFLANGEAGAPHEDRQPVLLSAQCSPSNGAGIAIIADGIWQPEVTAFERAILLFAPDQTGSARALWTRLGGEEHDLRIFKQRENGGWREGA